MLRERWEHFTHKEKIQKSTLETRFKKVREMIEKLPDLKSAIDNYDDIVKQANELEKGLD
jgi:ribosomal protein S20